MIFSKKLRKTAASVLALVMVFAMSTGAFAYGGLQDSTDDNSDGYYTVTVSYTVADLGNDLPEDAQISIIALAGAEDEDVEVEHNNNTATNVLWIDQQAVDKVNGGSFTFQVDADDAANGFHVKSGVTGGKTMGSYVTIATQTPPSQDKSNDATLASLTVGGQNVTLDHTNGIGSITLGANVASVAVVATKNHSAATVTGDGTVDLEVGDNEVKITVTAEDGTQKVYTITINNPAAQGGGDGEDDDEGETIPDANITIGGTQIGTGDGQVSASTPIASTKPFDIENGHIVRVKHAELEENETPTIPNKVVSHPNGGVQTFYTEYPTGTDGKTVIKLVTIITDETLTADELTLVEGTPTKLIYGNVNTSTGDAVDAYDVGTLIQMATGKAAVGENPFDRLTADVNGDGAVDAYDVGTIIQMATGKEPIPGAAKK